MAAFNSNTPGTQRFLIARDLKSSSSAARLQVLTVDESKGQSVAAVVVSPEQWGQWLPNDLESADPVPGTDNEFVIVESGFWEEKYGRVFRIAIQKTDDQWTGTVLQICRLPRTDRWFNIEGAGCFRWQGQNWLLLGDRATWSVSSKEQTSTFGTLFLTRLPHVEAPGTIQQLVWSEIAQVVAPRFQSTTMTDNYRHCSGIHLVTSEESKDVLSVWISAAFDPDRDSGPFFSQVWLAGTLNLSATSPFELFLKTESPTSHLWCNAIKIESLARSQTPSSLFSIGTDDENYPGVWRALPMAGSDPHLLHP